MSKGLKLLRLEYLFSVLVPCLIAIYLNDYDISNNLYLLAGFGFYAITGNTLNDMIDMKDPDEKETLERVKGYGRKEIGTLAIASFFLGTSCFMYEILEKPVLGIYLIIIVVLVIVYCLFKKLVVLNHIILGVSHIFLPYFMIKINAGDAVLNGILPEITVFEWLMLACVASVAYTGQMLHEMIDGDSLARLPPKTAQIVIWISAILSLIIGILSLIITLEMWFISFIIFPIGIMYIFRMPREDIQGWTSLKDIGIMLGNFLFVYILIIILGN
ncbi:MAG: UbiA family prenyltransferase [Promethearchaeota archaeon]